MFHEWQWNAVTLKSTSHSHTTSISSSRTTYRRTSMYRESTNQCWTTSGSVQLSTLRSRNSECVVRLTTRSEVAEWWRSVPRKFIAH